MTAQNIRTQIVTIQNTEYQNTNDSLQNREYSTQNTNDSLQNREYSTQNIRIQDVRMWDPKYQNPDRFNTATTEKTEYS